MSELDARLIAAHEAGDGPALVALYTRAAETAADTDAAAFYRTQALVFALESGHADAAVLHARLKADGRAD